MAVGAGTIGSPFIPGPRVQRAPRGQGRLTGLTFAAKDVFDVAGETTTYGSPDWARTHGPAAGTAPAVLTLLDAGGRLVGKTKTVELAFGLAGRNDWHGTPLNPAAPDRLPGGSSCGSASAVAGGEADFALGSDTGGSVRIPASYCGLFGMRPTHGAISMAGACGLAPSLDAAGWFTRGSSLLERVGDVLLPPGPRGGFASLLRPATIWLNADPAVADMLSHVTAELVPRLGRPAEIRLAHDGLDIVREHFTALQMEEAWVTLGGWITAEQPTLGADVARRLDAASKLDPAEGSAARAFRRVLQSRIWPLLDGGAVLIFPTSPLPAPLLSADAEELEKVREATLGVTALASLCGLPEVTLPAGRLGSLPIGLSLVAGRGRDRALLALARTVSDILGLPA